MNVGTQAVLAPYFEEPSADVWVRDVLLAYGVYYLHVLEHKMPALDAEALLRDNLLPFAQAGGSGSTLMALDDVEEALAVQFRERGFYFLGGQTLPYYGPYIWRRIDSRIFRVGLPNSVQEVPVHFLHEFLMRSWYHFNTFGKRGAAGWAKWNEPDWPDGLYCAYEAWHLAEGTEKSNFQNSFLKHEAQHLADFQRFPEIKPVDLEYRAKLVELIYLITLEDRFLSILAEAKDDPANPHSQAAYRLIQDFSRFLFDKEYVTEDSRWREIKYERIQAASRALLAKHGEALDAQKVETLTDGHQ